MLPPYSQNWNLSIERAIGKDYLFDIRYVGSKGTHLPRFVEANPSIYGPGVNANNNNQIRQYTTCNPAGVCDYGSVGLLANEDSSTYHALQVAFSRQYAHGLSFLRRIGIPRAWTGSLPSTWPAPRRLSWRRERSGAESLRPPRRTWAVAIRRHASLRLQRNLGTPHTPQRLEGRGAVGERVAAQYHRQPFHGHSVYGLRQCERVAAGQRARDQRILLQPTRSGLRSQHRTAAYSQPMGKPSVFPAAQSDHTSRAVRQ